MIQGFYGFDIKLEALLMLKMVLQYESGQIVFERLKSKIMSLSEFAIFASKSPTVKGLQLLYLHNKKKYQDTQYLIF